VFREVESWGREEERKQGEREGSDVAVWVTSLEELDYPIIRTTTQDERNRISAGGRGREKLQISSDCILHHLVQLIHRYAEAIQLFIQFRQTPLLSIGSLQ